MRGWLSHLFELIHFFFVFLKCLKIGIGEMLTNRRQWIGLKAGVSKDFFEQGQILRRNCLSIFWFFRFFVNRR